MSGKVIKVLTNIRFRRSAPILQKINNMRAADDLGEEFEERAAIMEFMGNMSRSEAEEMARQCLSKASINRVGYDGPCAIRG